MVFEWRLVNNAFKKSRWLSPYLDDIIINNTEFTCTKLVKN